jgi:hypothetical protein
MGPKLLGQNPLLRAGFGAPPVDEGHSPASPRPPQRAKGMARPTIEDVAIPEVSSGPKIEQGIPPGIRQEPIGHTVPDQAGGEPRRDVRCSRDLAIEDQQPSE